MPEDGNRVIADQSVQLSIRLNPVTGNMQLSLSQPNNLVMNLGLLELAKSLLLKNLKTQEQSQIVVPHLPIGN
jgi:hypothetical protein